MPALGASVFFGNTVTFGNVETHIISIDNI